MTPLYLAPSTLEEALDHLDRHGEATRLLAGGTDLLIALRSARREGTPVPPFLLDVSGIPELQNISAENGRIRLGAAVTFETMESHPLLKRAVPLLSEAAARMGSIQVRRLATIGGNVGTASPAGDGITPLTALSAKVQIVSRRGVRIVPLADLVTGPGKTGLTPEALIHSFSFAAPEHPHRCFFHKIMRRQAVAIARMNLAIQLALGPSGTVQSARIAAGAVFPSPRRLSEVEALLIGREPKEALFRECGRLAVEAMIAVSGRRSSMAYKVPALEQLVVWGLGEACGMAGKI